jgi:hypothetical protein
MGYEPIIPEGMHLGNSSEHEGAVTGHLFDENNDLQGHAAWMPTEEPKADPATTALLTAVAAGIGLGVAGYRKYGPVVEDWLKEDVGPAMKAGWGRIARRRPALAQPGEEAPVVLKVVPDEPSSQDRPPQEPARRTGFSPRRTG